MTVRSPSDAQVLRTTMRSVRFRLRMTVCRPQPVTPSVTANSAEALPDLLGRCRLCWMVRADVMPKG